MKLCPTKASLQGATFHNYVAAFAPPPNVVYSQKIARSTRSCNHHQFPACARAEGMVCMLP